MSDYLSRTYGDIEGWKLTRLSNPERSLRGAMLLALRALGNNTTGDVGALVCTIYQGEPLAVHAARWWLRLWEEERGSTAGLPPSLAGGYRIKRDILELEPATSPAPSLPASYVEADVVKEARAFEAEREALARTQALMDAQGERTEKAYSDALEAERLKRRATEQANAGSEARIKRKRKTRKEKREEPAPESPPPPQAEAQGVGSSPPEVRTLEPRPLSALPVGWEERQASGPFGCHVCGGQVEEGSLYAHATIKGWDTQGEIPQGTVHLTCVHRKAAKLLISRESPPPSLPAEPINLSPWAGAAILKAKRRLRSPCRLCESAILAGEQYRGSPKKGKAHAHCYEEAEGREVETEALRAEEAEEREAIQAADA